MSEQQTPLVLSELKGTICVVTGAGNRGIGYGICEVAAELGLHVAVLDLHESVCKETANVLSNKYPNVTIIGVQCDVTNVESLKKSHQTITQKLLNKRIGAVFANAGVIFPAAGILNSEIDNWKTTFEVNVFGTVNTIKEFVPELQLNEKPSVFCTTSSISGLTRGLPGVSDYGASKHAVVALTEALSMELAKSSPQIRVCVCCPCIVTTALFETSQINKDSKQGDRIDARSPEASPASSLPVYRLGMTSYDHGRQVWDRIAAGEFYMICENQPPYVSHNFPFGAAQAVVDRFKSINKPDFKRKIDNSFGIKSPLMKEINRILKSNSNL